MLNRREVIQAGAAATVALALPLAPVEAAPTPKVLPSYRREDIEKLRKKSGLIKYDFVQQCPTTVKEFCESLMHFTTRVAERLEIDYVFGSLGRVYTEIIGGYEVTDIFEMAVPGYEPQVGFWPDDFSALIKFADRTQYCGDPMIKVPSDPSSGRSFSLHKNFRHPAAELLLANSDLTQGCTIEIMNLEI